MPPGLYLPLGLKQEAGREESKAGCLKIWTSHFRLEHSKCNMRNYTFQIYLFVLVFTLFEFL